MRSSSTTTVPATVTGLPPSISFAVPQLLSIIAPPLSSNDDPIPSVENEAEMPLLPVQRLMPAAGQQQEQRRCDHASLSEPAHISEHSFIQHPVSITPPLPVEPNTRPSHPTCPVPQILNVLPPFLARRLQERMTSLSNQDFSDDEDDIDERSPAPSTARRTSIFKNLAPISICPTLRLSLPPATFYLWDSLEHTQYFPSDSHAQNSRDDDNSVVRARRNAHQLKPGHSQRQYQQQWSWGCQSRVL
jgi:hypothetical protein